MLQVGMIMLVLLILVVLGVILYFVTIYNGLIRLKNNMDKSWSNIDVLLKQRHDEIPKLVAICEGYMKYEQETLKKVIEARSLFDRARGVAQTAEADQAVTQALKSLFALAENYPDLKADNNFLGLQGRVSTLENSIADRREFFNDSVNLYNIRIQQIPDILVAQLFNFESAELWRINPPEREDVKISFNPAGGK
ncbi:MAG: LemA family protein [Proteobacteria bacterium]|nr:LemA family protein [Pseudomonadota bacterium]